MRPIALLMFAFYLTFQGIAQVKEAPSPIIFIYDASGSMWGQMQGKTKMEIASDVLSTSVNNLPDNQKIGLVAYGHRKKSDCKDVEFLVDAANGTKSKDKLGTKRHQTSRNDSIGLFGYTSYQSIKNFTNKSNYHSRNRWN